MKYLLLFILLFPVCLPATGQTYRDSMLDFRNNYLSELLTEKGGPLKAAQVKNVGFFAADKNYRVWADFKETPGAVPFMLHTHSGKSKPYKEYGVLKFTIHDTLLSLHIYQSTDMLKDAQYKDNLFLPFKDMTNYEATYGGGRYIDLKVADVKNGRVLLDFNKAYNPYCAYVDGYSCPIPPEENKLQIEIPAGEKTYIP